MSARGFPYSCFLGHGWVADLAPDLQDMFRTLPPNIKMDPLAHQPTQ